VFYLHTDQTVCPCDCIYHEKVETAKNKTRQKKSMDELKVELGPQLQKMKKNLTVDTSTLSAFINRLVLQIQYHVPSVTIRTWTTRFQLVLFSLCK
jgi:FKBP-type peptidyl-prolyl cis-trans isomerase (trigger factor)